MTPIENNWEKEFDLRFNNWKTDPEFWQNDIQNFIQSLLNNQEKEFQEALAEQNDHWNEVLRAEREELVKKIEDLKWGAIPETSTYEEDLTHDDAITEVLSLINENKE